MSFIFFLLMLPRLSPSKRSAPWCGLPPQLAGKPEAEPSAISSLSEAGDRDGGSRSGQSGRREPVKGSPYEWVLIRL